MKTLKSIGMAVLTAAVLIACNNEATKNTEVESGISGAYNADLTASVVNWKGGMIAGKSHTGTLSLSEGSVTVENDNISGGSFTIDMTSMKTTDENYDTTEHTREGLLGHLGKGDFFQIDSFATASFKITGADSTGVVGDLTIRGISNSEKVTDVVVEKTEAGIRATGNLTFDRTKYGVNFDTKSKDYILSNDIELNIEVVAQP